MVPHATLVLCWGGGLPFLLPGGLPVVWWLPVPNNGLRLPRVCDALVCHAIGDRAILPIRLI